VEKNALEDLGLGVLELGREQRLCAAAVGAPRLGEDRDRVVADGVLIRRPQLVSHAVRLTRPPASGTHLDGILYGHDFSLVRGRVRGGGARRRGQLMR
jgi:hypothetical protein